jgi:hypothetical protein
MDRMQTIQRLLAVKDTVYGLLEWAENVSDEEFGQCRSLDCLPPEETLLRMEAFCQLSQELVRDYAGIVRGLDGLCAGDGGPATGGGA